MLLQITEPKVSLDKETRVFAVGIDLGTTHSVIAYSNEGQPVILKKDLLSKGLVPSVVAYLPGAPPCVGEEAKQLLKKHPEVVVSSIKRLMGRGLTDDALMNFPHPVKETENGLALALPHSLLTPTEISADILRELYRIIQDVLGYPVSKAVITVPAYFDEAAREATRDAGKLAGFEVLRLLNEPTAAALAYNLDEKGEGLYGVYDLGGGTFDFSLLHMQKGVFKVLATGGDLALGGDDFDQAIAVHALRNMFHKLPFEKQKQILEKAKLLKESLTFDSTGFLEWECELEAQAPKKFQFSKEMFERLIDPFLNRTLFLVERVLKDANVAKEALLGIICVGGSTRIPYVQETLEAFFNRVPLTTLDPDYAVALGAAKQAEALTYGASHLLLDVTPLSLGIETMGGLVERLISRNSPLPLEVSQIFTTFQENQTAIKIHVVQGERDMVKECRSLAHFELQGIPPMPSGRARISVTFILDANGLLTVKAHEKETNVFQMIQVKPTYGLTSEKMKQLLEESHHFNSEAVVKRIHVQQKLEAQQSLREVEKLLKQAPSFLSEKDKKDLTHACERLSKAIEDAELTHLKNVLEAFNQLCLPFIEKLLQHTL